MNGCPFVSIVIPARNEADTIARCLDSIMALDYPPDAREVVLVDNGSSDATAATARQYPVVLVSEPRPGHASARNAGIRAARGDIIAFIDGDCIAEPGWLQELLADAGNPAVGCFVGAIVPLDTRGLIARWSEDRELIGQDRLLSSSPALAAGGNTTYRRSVFDAIGLFDEAMVCGEDGDLFWRMQRSDKFLMRYCRKARVRHPHPTHLGELLRRAFTEGRGLALFRLKHRNDHRLAMTSLPRAWIEFGKILAGALICPVRIANDLRHGQPVSQSVAFPLLDKAYSIFRFTGLLYQLTLRYAA